MGHEDEGHLSLRNLEWGPTMVGAHDGGGGGLRRLGRPRTLPRSHTSAEGQGRGSRVRHSLTRVLPWSAAGSLSPVRVTGHRRQPCDPPRRSAQQVLRPEQLAQQRAPGCAPTLRLRPLVFQRKS